MQIWLNTEIFKGGVKFPYKPTQFLTNLQFSPKAAHMMFTVEAEMEELLEERLW